MHGQFDRKHQMNVSPQNLSPLKERTDPSRRDHSEVAVVQVTGIGGNTVDGPRSAENFGWTCKRKLTKSTKGVQILNLNESFAPT